jgi:hypothetical protein
MSPLPRAPKSESLFRALAGANEESAAATAFMELYRHSAALRHWLREDYARNAKLRAQFDGRAMASGSATVVKFAELTDESASWQEEQRRMRAEVSGKFYGGLSWAEVEKLVLHYQAGTLDLGVFLLAHEWRQAGEDASRSPTLQRGAVQLVDLALRFGQTRLLKHLARASRFLRVYSDKPKRRSMVGYADWWKLHTLLYILRHPCEAYRTRELRAHLSMLGLNVSTKDMRRFCTRHGISRDMRAGRPRTRTLVPSQD